MVPMPRELRPQPLLGTHESCFQDRSCTQLHAAFPARVLSILCQPLPFCCSHLISLYLLLRPPPAGFLPRLSRVSVCFVCFLRLSSPPLAGFGLPRPLLAGYCAAGYCAAERRSVQLVCLL